MSCSTHVSPGPTADDLVVLGRLEALDGKEIEDGLKAVRGQEPPLKLPALRLLAANDPEPGSEMKDRTLRVRKLMASSHSNLGRISLLLGLTGSHPLPESGDLIGAFRGLPRQPLGHL